MDSLWTPRNITSLDGSYYEVIDSSIAQNIFSYLKIFSMQCRKNITVERKYIYIYTPTHPWLPHKLSSKR